MKKAGRPDILFLSVHSRRSGTFMKTENVSSNLKSPPETWTEEGFALLWDPPERQPKPEYYKIFINDKETGRTRDTDYTVRGLKSSETYKACVYKVENGRSIPVSPAVTITTRPKPEIFDVTSFGAVGDGKALNTEAIQRAVDACSHGGRVYIPKGVFLTGPIYLKSDMTLYVEEGGKLLGSENLKDYPLETYRFEGLETACYASLVGVKGNGSRYRNIVIAGPGTIDASGSPLRKKELEDGRGKPGRAICLRNTDGVYLQDITVRQSPAWCVHMIYCNDIALNNVKIYTKYDENGIPYAGIENGDGFDPDSCRNVSVFRCTIASEDDCIAIKSGKDAEGRKVGIPSENISITNCTFQSGFGVAVGSEMSGGVRNVLVRDCRFENVYCAVSIKTLRGRGGVIENIRYENIVHHNGSTEYRDCKWFRGAVNIDQFYSHEKFDVNQPETVTDGTPVIRNILLKNMTIDTVAGNAVYLAGLPESPLENLRLENIRAVGKYGMKIYNTSRSALENIEVHSRTNECRF